MHFTGIFRHSAKGDLTVVYLCAGEFATQDLYSPGPDGEPVRLRDGVAHLKWALADFSGQFHGGGTGWLHTLTRGNGMDNHIISIP